jgi:hypothetical protein
MLANPGIMVSDVGRRLGITRHALPLFACGKDSARPTTPIGAHQEFCTALRRQWHQRLRRRRNEVQKCNATPAATPFRNVHFTSIPAFHCVSSPSASSARSLSAPMIRRRCGSTDVAPAAGTLGSRCYGSGPSWTMPSFRSRGLGSYSRIAGLLLLRLRPFRRNHLSTTKGFRFQWRRDRIACCNILLWRFSGRPNWRSR